jgi:protein Cut8
MNSVVATPPVPPHFHESTRLSPSRSSEFPLTLFKRGKKKGIMTIMKQPSWF